LIFLLPSQSVEDLGNARLERFVNWKRSLHRVYENVKENEEGGTNILGKVGVQRLGGVVSSRDRCTLNEG
jgi:hypothetical protein